MAKLERLITPKGVKNITENGEYEIASYESVDVDVEVKARVEGTTLVIPKSTTAAPSMSAKFIERVYYNSNTHFALSNVLSKDKLYLIKYHQADIGLESIGIFGGSFSAAIISGVDYDTDECTGCYLRLEWDLNFISFYPLLPSITLSVSEEDYIDIYELPITFPTIEGE